MELHVQKIPAKRPPRNETTLDLRSLDLLPDQKLYTGAILLQNKGGRLPQN